MQERRSTTRIPIQSICTYMRENSTKWKSCILTDVSYEGLGVRLPEYVGPDNTLMFKIRTASQTSVIFGRLTWISSLAGMKIYMTGAHLIEADEDRMKHFVDCAATAFPKAEGGDR